MKGNVGNIVLVVAVVALVAGVAWFRGGHSNRTAPAADPPGAGATATATQPATEAAAGLPSVVDLGADKCIPCKQMAPILAELKKEYEGRAIVEFIDVWKNPSAGDLYGIRMIPTQVFFDGEGKEVWRHEGFLSKADFVAKFAEMGVK
jgi:thioredoxin 1